MVPKTSEPKSLTKREDLTFCTVLSHTPANGLGSQWSKRLPRRMTSPSSYPTPIEIS